MRVDGKAIVVTPSGAAALIARQMQGLLGR